MRRGSSLRPRSQLQLDDSWSHSLTRSKPRVLRPRELSCLLDFLTPEVYLKWLKLPGVAGSRIPASSADPRARAVARLADLSTGGKTGTKNDDLRRCLSDVTPRCCAAAVIL